MMQTALVPPEHVYDVCSRMYRYMDKAAYYTRGRYEAQDILDAIVQYNHQLWVAFEDADIKGIAVTSFKQYPRMKCLDVIFCAGTDGRTWKDPMLEMLQHWAHDNGCDRIEATGRLGWAKVFEGEGSKPLWQVFELPVADKGLGE